MCTQARPPAAAMPAAAVTVWGSLIPVSINCSGNSARNGPNPLLANIAGENTRNLSSDFNIERICSAAHHWKVVPGW